MRKLSRAHIRVLGKDQIPKCASEDEEVVQTVNGQGAASLLVNPIMLYGMLLLRSEEDFQEI
ncbi:hypothetical protein L484_011801 [Morus notabilis]|uniref:Uncharacterized protein n=1 Tax=Morus notabilis TaxID=981085 RepID=W9SED3_9ROSA|nr:hypothetical protein L484_011801 [Morus notabilis]